MKDEDVRRFSLAKPWLNDGLQPSSSYPCRQQLRHFHRGLLHGALHIFSLIFIFVLRKFINSSCQQLRHFH